MCAYANGTNYTISYSWVFVRDNNIFPLAGWDGVHLLLCFTSDVTERGG